MKAIGVKPHVPNAAVGTALENAKVANLKQWQVGPLQGSDIPYGVVATIKLPESC